MIVHINSRHLGETIEAPEPLLDALSCYIGEGAEHLRDEGNDELAHEAYRIAQEIYEALQAGGYFLDIQW